MTDESVAETCVTDEPVADGLDDWNGVGLWDWYGYRFRYGDRVRLGNWYTNLEENLKLCY